MSWNKSYEMIGIFEVVKFFVEFFLISKNRSKNILSGFPLCGGGKRKGGKNSAVQEKTSISTPFGPFDDV
jgi:hypothetical protein